MTTQQTAHTTSPIGLVILLLVGCIGGWIWWRSSTHQLAPTKPPLSPICQYWIGISGDVGAPAVLCLQSKQMSRETLLCTGLQQAKPRCPLPPRVPMPKHGESLHIARGSSDDMCRITMRQLPASFRVLHGLPLSLNHASAKDLAAIPLLRKRVAQRIVAYRKQKGPFQAIRELLQIKGIGPKTLTRIQPYVHLQRHPTSSRQTAQPRAHVRLARQWLNCHRLGRKKE